MTWLPWVDLAIAAVVVLALAGIVIRWAYIDGPWSRWTSFSLVLAVVGVLALAFVVSGIATNAWLAEFVPR